MKSKSFQGGYKFRELLSDKSVGITRAAEPGFVVIPLCQGAGGGLEPGVSVGNKVAAGDIIARDDDSVSSPVHSSISGIVKEISKGDYFGKDLTFVTIEKDSSSDFTALDGASKDWQKLSSEIIEKILYESGVTSAGRDGIPTSYNSSVIHQDKVGHVIIHGLKSDPYGISVRTLLAGKNMYNFVEGVKILKKIMPSASVHIALDGSEKSHIEEVKKLTRDMEKTEICSVEQKYPGHYDAVLVREILGEKFPYGYSAVNMGIIVLNVETVLLVYEAVCEGKPLIEKTVTLAGPGIKESINIKVKIGTAIKDILKDKIDGASSRVILNSVMTGLEIKDLTLPVDRTFNQIIVVPEDKNRKFMAFVTPVGGVTTNLHGEERPCIQCSNCIEVCPVQISPALIDRHIKRGDNERLIQLNILNCLDCNLCTFVCPSKIPLAANIKKSKDFLAGKGWGKEKFILPKFHLKGIKEYKKAEAA